MIIDRELRFSDAQALTTSAVSANIIDLVNPRDMGIGDRPALKLAMSVGTAFTSTGSSTLTILAQGSTDNSTWTTYAQSPAIAKASLAANTEHIWDIDWPRKALGAAMPRYLRLSYTVGVADFTAGTLTAQLVLDRQDDFAYPAGITVAN